MATGSALFNYDEIAFQKVYISLFLGQHPEGKHASGGDSSNLRSRMAKLGTAMLPMPGLSHQPPQSHEEVGLVRRSLRPMILIDWIGTTF